MNRRKFSLWASVSHRASAQFTANEQYLYQFQPWAQGWFLEGAVLFGLGERGS